MTTCKYCGRGIVLVSGGSTGREWQAWIDPEATGDDAIWREVCGSHDTFTAEHEPAGDGA